MADNWMVLADPKLLSCTMLSSPEDNPKNQYNTKLRLP